MKWLMLFLAWGCVGPVESEDLSLTGSKAKLKSPPFSPSNVESNRNRSSKNLGLSSLGPYTQTKLKLDFKKVPCTIISTCYISDNISHLKRDVLIYKNQSPSWMWAIRSCHLLVITCMLVERGKIIFVCILLSLVNTCFTLLTLFKPLPFQDVILIFIDWDIIIDSKSTAVD